MTLFSTDPIFTPSIGSVFVIAAALMIAGGCSLDQPLEESQPPTVEAPTAEEESVVCAACHENHVRLWKYGGHSAFSCERCHGPAGAHAEANIDPRPTMRLGDDPTLCLSCHGRFETRRPGKIPQVVSLDVHVKYVGEKHSVPTDVTKTGGKCTYCHDPHSME